MKVPVPFARFRSEVLSHYRDPLARKATRLKVSQVLREFEGLCPTTRDLTVDAIIAWIQAHPGRRRATVRTLLSALRAAINLVGADYEMGSPFLRRKLHRFLPPETGRPIVRHKTPAEIAAVLLQADQEASGGCWKARRLRVLVNLAAYTGARGRELLGLEVEDLDLAGGLIRIRPNARRLLKTESSERVVPMAAPLHGAIAEWVGRLDRRSPWLIPHGRLDGPWLQARAGYRPVDQVKALGRRAGVQDLTLLSFRHSFATAADRWRIGGKALQDLMGHSTPMMQFNYRHPDPEEMRASVGRVKFA